MYRENSIDVLNLLRWENIYWLFPWLMYHKTIYSHWYFVCSDMTHHRSRMHKLYLGRLQNKKWFHPNFVLQNGILHFSMKKVSSAIVYRFVYFELVSLDYSELQNVYRPYVTNTFASTKKFWSFSKISHLKHIREIHTIKQRKKSTQPINVICIISNKFVVVDFWHGIAYG